MCDHTSAEVLMHFALAGPTDGADPKELPLNWGPEGEEGPLLATGSAQVLPNLSDTTDQTLAPQAHIDRDMHFD